MTRTLRPFQLIFAKKKDHRANQAATHYEFSLRPTTKKLPIKIFRLFFISTLLFLAANANIIIRANIFMVNRSTYLHLIRLSRYSNNKIISCSPSSYVIGDDGENYQQQWVGCDKSLIDRLTCYNQVVTLNRDKMLNRNVTVTWPMLAATKFYVNLSNHLQMEDLRNSSSVITTVYLDYLGPPLDMNWSFRHPLANRSFLQMQHYDWEGMYPVCEWLKSFIRYKGDTPCFHSALSQPNKQVTK